MRTIATVLSAALLAACGQSTKVDRRSFVDESASLSYVGWLGARVQPLTTVLKIEHDDETHVPGGVVVRELAADAALTKAGAKVGDVIVRVDGTWLPVTDNMHRKFVEMVEQGVSGGKKQIPIAVYRKGKLASLTLPSALEPMENGLPVDVSRFRQGAKQAVAAFPENAERATAWAILGLALLANGHEGALLERAEAAVRKASDDPKTDTVTRCWALLFEAQRVGALPDAYVLAMKPKKGSAPAPGPKATGGKGRAITPEMLKEMMKGGAVKIGKGGSGGPPPRLQKPKKKPAPSKGKKDEEKSEEEKKKEAEEKKRKAREAAHKKLAAQTERMKKLIEEHDPERLPKLERLGALAKTLLEQQADEGGWSGSGKPDATTTSLALWALGSVLRVGGTVDPVGIEKGIAYLREALHEGKLAIEVAKGADRRTEVGRAALGSVALQALGCPEEDKMLKALTKFSDQLGKEVLNAEGDRTTPLVAIGVGRRGRALAAWQSFFDEFRLALVAHQTPDGCFQPFDDGPLGDTASATAAGALLYGLQSAKVSAILGTAENPLAPRWNSEGKLIFGKTAGAGRKPAGAPTPQQLMEMLKKAGVQMPGK